MENRLEKLLAKTPVSDQDRRLIQELVYGVVRWQSTLDWLIDRQLSRRPPAPEVRVLLRLGLYQLFWLDHIPDHAAVNETVELAKQRRLSYQARFLNAVLRGYGREAAAAERLLEDLKTRQPSLGYSHPDWLCERWEQAFGRENLIALLRWNNTPPPTFARLNALRSNSASLAALWQAEGVSFTARTWDWTGDGLVFQLGSHPYLGALPSFRQGCFYVQDPSTLLAVRELDPRPGETVLDFCAAPGGKTTFMAQLMQNRGQIVALDNRVIRLELLKENCTRLGITCVNPILAPPQLPEPLGSRLFDKVLVDAPCSNTGVMRRRVDLRWRLQPSELSRLQNLQSTLLRQGALHLKPGGTLVYSTCSLEPEENRRVVDAFLAKSPDYQLEMERQLLPFADGVDGAYTARIRRGQEREA
ncbi:MAG: 16S rRNA (cytosine(967)-C(5))-methyltransferase RsmB [Candidatus Omnitrophica bacterium]|nr:16S rRNA (cytosine(967)-C(5))-methyltransferase RsmB [Candidatus Omnitrophota bacterium]